MTLWRWSGEDISEICVQFSFETKKQVSISTISSQPTREHGKLKKQNRSAIKKLIKVEAKTGTFVRFQPDTGTLIGATINKDDFKFYLFNFQFYSCTVRWSKQTVTREVCTISCQADDQAYDVVGDFDTKELILRPQQPISIEHPDERFFIYYEIGETGDKVFELLLYPNQCIKYSSAKQCLELEELGMSKSKSKRSFINPKTQFQFEPQTSLEETEVRKYVKSHKYGLCCFSSTEENNQGPYLDGIKPCNEFKLKSEEDVKTELSMESGNGDEIDACISITSLTRDI
ncbi:uncharacterized protein LOC134277780 [Saccostrea cucullata]|uniref:uncharacterized protein LOC134277780 n=1 Tax=Saccostrea cuccullata TaxID=36930 RepID=UPI002ED596AD